MGIPETIVAAGIGGTATIMAALFQLYTALRVKTKADSRPKKGNLLRSSVAIAALMIASAAGGYAFSEFRQQQALEDARAMHEELRGMRDEINARLQALTQTAEHLAHERDGTAEAPADTEALLLARGPLDRSCEQSGDAPSACDTAPRPVAPPPGAAASATDGR